MTISVTIPVYNEEHNLQPLCERLVPVLESLGLPWEVVFVNDGSTDGTAAVLDTLASLDARLKVIHFRRNTGQTAAMMAGFEHARGDIIVPMDADLQNDPLDIPLLLEKLNEGFDVCSGWRKDRHDHSLRGLYDPSMEPDTSAVVARLFEDLAANEAPRGLPGLDCAGTRWEGSAAGLGPFRCVGALRFIAPALR